MNKLNKTTISLLSVVALSSLIVSGNLVLKSSNNLKADEVTLVKDATPKSIKSNVLRGDITVYYDDIILPLGTNLPAPMDIIRNPELLPEGTTAQALNNPELSRPGDYPAQSQVVYTDGTTQRYYVRAHVKDLQTGFGGELGDPNKLSGKYIPKGDDIIVPINSDANDYVQKAVINKEDMPEGTTYKFKSPIDTTSAGDREAFIVVTYSDGSTDEIKIAVHVQKEQKFKISYYQDNNMFPAKGQDVTTYVGTPVSSDKGIANKDELPNEPTTPIYSWKKEPDWNTVGTKPAIVLVDYPDGTRNEVKINVHVLEIPDNQKYKLQGNTIITKVGTSLESKEGIKNNSELPEGTVYEWLDNEPDWNTPWKVFDHKVKVTYPDKTTAEETAKITVYDMFEGQDIYVDQNAKADIIKGIKDADKYSDIIKDIKFEWEKEPDTSKGGVFPAKINVTYPEAWGNVTYVLDINVHVTIPWTEIGPSTPIEKPDTSIPWTPLEPSIPTEKPSADKPTTDDKPKVDRVTPKELPKTGEKTTHLLGFGLGVLIVGLLGLISLHAMKPKRKDNKN